MTTTDFYFKAPQVKLTANQVSWQSPSNIALVKYWGKYGEQMPKNTSISFTLTNCHTKTTLYYEPKTGDNFQFKVYLDGQRETTFEPKILKFFQRIEAYVPFLKHYNFKIETSNSFPHSSGIASSASGMSAIALCLMSIEQKLTESVTSSVVEKSYFNRKASFLARLGSGSACRSVEGELVVWGETEQISGSSNLYGVRFEGEVHTNFHNYQDTILLVDKGEKQVSSTVGHQLMHEHPFATERFAQAEENIAKLKTVLSSGDLNKFIEIVESEALTLHAMMMTSMPYFILMKPNTLEIINKIWEYRVKTNSKLCFTLDAGANVHVLYPHKEKETILEFIKDELVSYCQNEHYICDQIGLGAQPI